MFAHFGIFSYICPKLSKTLNFTNMIRKFIVLSMLCFVSIVALGQTVSIGPFSKETQQFKMDTRHINWSDFTGLQPSRMAVTRGDGPGWKWIDRIGNMPDYLIDFYQVFGEQVKEVMNGGANWLSDPTKAENDGSDTYYVIIKNLSGSVDFTFPVGSSEDVIYQAFHDALNAEFNNIIAEYNCFMRYLILCLNYDYPEAFWTGNEARWGWGSNYGGNYDPSAGTGTVTYTIPLTFTLKEKYQNNYTLEIEDYDYRIEGFRTQQQISDGVAEFNAKVKAVSDPFVGMSRYEQVIGLNDWLTEHNSYNSDLIETGTADDIAWSPLSALRESTGPLGPVCEGYARAFKVLCDKIEIPCVLATGNAKSYSSDPGGAHMWNEVQMENNKWYAVDVTWDDPGASSQKISGYESRSWLLLGKKDEVALNFTFEDSHPVETPGAGTSDEDIWDLSFGSMIEDYHYEPVQSITLKNNKLAYYCDKNLDFSDREDVKAFVVTGYDYQGETSTIYLTRVKDVPAGTPIIVKGTAGTTYNIPIKASSSSYYENMLKGNTTGSPITLNPTEGDYMNMVMSGGQFWAFDSPISFPANMSYLQLPKPAAMPSATPGSSQTVKINNDKGKVTLCSTVDLDFSSLEGDGVKAFIVTGYDNSSSVIWLTRVTHVSAGVGLIVKGPKGEYSVPSSGAQTSYANMLVGNNSGSSVSLAPSDATYTYMVMSKGEFLSFGSTIDFPSGMAYLRIPKTALAMTRSAGNDTPSSSYSFTEEPEVISMTIDTRSISGEGDTTGIHEAKREGVNHDEWYTLQGQRVTNPGKGLYIKNGKKVVIR